MESKKFVKVGEVKLEKDSEKENIDVATNKTIGDQAKIDLDDDETELAQLDFKKRKDICDNYNDGDNIE